MYINIAVNIRGFVALLTSPSALKILAVTFGSKKIMFSKNMISP